MKKDRIDGEKKKSPGKALKVLARVAIVAFWLGLWQIVSMLVNNPVVLVGPYETCRALWELAREGEFYLSVGSSVLRIVSGFLLGSLLGVAFAVLSYLRGWFRAFIRPFVSAVKAVPVVSFVILILVGFGSRVLSLVISATVVFPLVYIQTLEGLDGVDARLLEVASVFGMKKSKRVRLIYLPALRRHWTAALKTAVGMSWKSGAAAEVIGQPLHSIGNEMYRSKIFLETSHVLAWTVVIVLLSFCMEKLFLWLLRRLIPGRAPGNASEKKESEAGSDPVGPSGEGRHETIG